MKPGKRFLFGIIAMICVSITTIWLKYPADIYMKIVGGIVGIYVIGQSYTDTKNKGGKNV